MSKVCYSKIKSIPGIPVKNFYIGNLSESVIIFAPHELRANDTLSLQQASFI